MPLENLPEMGVLIDVSSFSKNEITPNENGEIQIIKSIEKSNFAFPGLCKSVATATDLG